MGNHIMPPKKSKPEASSKRKRSPTPPTSDDQLKRVLSFLLNDAPNKFGNGASAKQPNLFDHIAHSKDYTPFQNLVAAAVMSKPISSRLGVRTLLTIFDDAKDGVDFSTPEKLRDAGEDGRYDALSKAKTQHKDKTSLQLGRLADRVIEMYSESEGDTSLKKLREDIGKPDNLSKVLKEFYGVGDTATDVFRRRMQADWEELYPFADERTINAAAHLGLVHDSADKLAEQVKSLLPAEDSSEERQQYSRIVDALVACDLEHQYENLIELVGEGGVDAEENGEAADGDEDEKPAKKSAKKA